MDPQVEIYDTTLRDGSQAEGVNFSVVDKLRVAERILSSTRRIKHLETLLPICSYCKRIQRQDKSWTSLETYLSRTMETHVSHGICPECMTNYVEPQISSLPEKPSG